MTTIATGTIKVEFEVIDGVLDCSGYNLTSLVVPSGVTYLNCSYNNLTKRNVPQ